MEGGAPAGRCPQGHSASHRPAEHLSSPSPSPCVSSPPTGQAGSCSWVALQLGARVLPSGKLELQSWFHHLPCQTSLLVYTTGILTSNSQGCCPDRIPRCPRCAWGRAQHVVAATTTTTAPAPAPARCSALTVLEPIACLGQARSPQGNDLLSFTDTMPLLHRKTCANKNPQSNPLILCGLPVAVLLTSGEHTLREALLFSFWQKVSWPFKKDRNSCLT